MLSPHASRLLSTEVSQEFFAVQPERKFGLALLTEIERLMALAKTTDIEDFGGPQPTLGKIIKDHTRLNVDVRIDQFGRPNGYLQMMFPTISSGVLKFGELAQHNPQMLDWTKDRFFMGEVNFTTGMIDKDFKGFKGVVGLASEYFYSPQNIASVRGVADFTAEEILSTILHEIGHMLTILGSVGDVACLDYYLTEGVEILLGRQAQGTVKIKGMTVTHLQDRIKDPTIKTALNEPNEENLRIAILDLYRADRRHQLGSSTTSEKRAEQMADLYVSRMGFSRALATGIWKENQLDRRYYRGRKEFVATQILKLVATATVTFLSPLSGMALIAVAIYFSDTELTSPYDDPNERIRKVRNDLIFQLKDPLLTQSRREVLLDDLKVVDKTLETLNRYPDLFESLAFVYNRGQRRDTQLARQEEHLQQLLNNDIFVAVNQLKLKL